MYALTQQGVTLRTTEQPVDTRSAAGKAFLDMLGIFAEFETKICDVNARWKGLPRRKPLIDPAEVWHLYTTEKMGATALARQLGMGLT